MKERRPAPSGEADGIIEGRNAVTEALRAGTPIDKIYLARGETDAALGHIASTARSKGVVVVECDRRKLDGMREMLSTTALIMGRGMDEDCALVTDGRFSGATHGPCIGHISPEAAAGGPIALVEDGDEIFIDIAARRLELKVSPEELERRRAVWKPLVKPRGPALAKYAAHVSSADRGAIIELEK